jgi:hypothetical protein
MDETSITSNPISSGVEQTQDFGLSKEKNKGGRPEEYKEEYCEKVDEYLKECQDEEIRVIKQSNLEKGYEMYDNRLKVKLPTIEGFALFIGVSKKSIYNWEKDNPKFLHSLDKIKTEQQQRLIDKGLSGDYNSTIAKLILSANHGMRERTDITTDDKELPTPIYGGNSKF